MKKNELVEVQTTPMQLLEVAVNSGADPDKLEKLMALQERWERNQAEKAFATAMHAAQKDMPNVARDAKNSHHNKYALLESIQKAAKPVYEKHGFCLSFGEADCPLDRHKRTVCDVTHTAGHTRRYHLDLPVDASGSMNAIQGCVSTTSYAQRRLTAMIWNITIGGEDDDGQGATETITDDQVAVLNSLLERTPPADNVLDGMLRWLSVDSLDKIPVKRFAEAKQKLAAKVAQYEPKA